MPFTRPTLTQIVDRIRGDFKSGLGLTTILRRSFLDVLAKAEGGASHTLHGHIEWASEQLFPDTADEEFLLRWGTIFGVPRNDATFAEITVEFTGTTGGNVPLGTIIQRADGVEYEMQAAVVVPVLGTAQGIATASIAGLSGNISNGSTLSLLSPIAGVQSTAVVIGTVVEGEDQESIENYRTRVIERIQSPPAGGTVNDYIAFAKIAGVTRVWVTPTGLGEGTVVVYFVEDGQPVIIPTQAKIDEVLAAMLPLIPVTADLYVAAPVAVPLNLTIALSPNTVEVQTAVEAEIADMLLREAEVGGSFKAVGQINSGTISLSKINEAISLAADEDDHVLISPTTDVLASQGKLVVPGVLTFTTL